MTHRDFFRRPALARLELLERRALFAASVTLVTRSEAFPSDATDGFGAFNLPQPGTSIGFSPTNHAGDALGEAGGTFSRSTGLHAYADTKLGGTLARSENLNLSGDLVVTANSNFNGGIFAGYFNTEAPAGQMLGFVVAEPGGTVAAGQFRGKLYARSANGVIVSSADVGLALGVHYHFSIAYNGATHRLSGRVGTKTLSTSALVAGLADTFNAFGIGTGLADASGAGGNDAAERATAYFDNLTYSAVTARPVSPPPGPATRTETFPSDLGDGYVPFALPHAGTSIGFSATNHAGGAVGEAGGVFSRSASIHAYADTKLGGTLERGQNLILSGDVAVMSNNNFDGGIFAGYFNTAAPTGQLIGFVISEPGGTVPTGEFRGKLYLRTADDTVVRSTEVGMVLGQHYHFNLAYSGTTHILSGTIGNQKVSTPALPSGLADTFNAFGVGTGLAVTTGAGGDDPNKQATVYFDNLTYTVLAGAGT